MKLDEIQIELAGLCNATCVYCTWQKRETGKQLMDRDLALGLLQEAKEMDVQSVRYHGVGESTLHPDLIEIITLGEHLGLNHSISTNCYTLRGDLANGLKKVHGLALILAIPWVMPEKFVNVCINNAIDYIAGGFDNHRLHIQMVCHENAVEHYRRCVDLFLPFVERSPNAYLHLKQPVTWPSDSPNRGFINDDLRNHPKVIHDHRVTPVSIGAGCNMPERFLMIHADGNCVPCCVGIEDWGLGSVGVANRSTSVAGLKEVWQSSRMEMIRGLWKAQDDSIPCGHCKKRTDCLQAQ